MTTTQVALSGGMSLMDCLVLVVGLAIVFGSMSSRSSSGIAVELPTAEPTAAEAAVPVPAVDASLPFPEPSATQDFQFPTFTPYGTPADSPTPSPSATSSMQGWVKFSVREVEMWMPGTYAAGNPHTDADAIVASLKEKGANFNFDAIKKNLTTSKKNYVLWGIDSFQGNPAIVTNVFVVFDFADPGEPLADYARQFIGAMSGDFELIEQRSIASPIYEIDQVLLETKNPLGAPTRLVMDAIRDKNVIWSVLCITATDEMKVRLPAFDLMAATFRVLAAPA
jgi:hypothetical protein